MRSFYPAKAIIISAMISASLSAKAQTPTTVTPGICTAIIADFNAGANNFNAPSIYGAQPLDSSFYYYPARGYWSDYVPGTGQIAQQPRNMSIISPPFANPNPSGTFNIGFHYIVGDPNIDRFAIRIISLTQGPSGTEINIEAQSPLRSFASFSSPVPYSDLTASPAVPDPSPLFTGFEGNVCIRLIDPDIVNAPNTTFRVEVTYALLSSSFAAFDNVSVGPSNIPLPVNFIGLVANRKDAGKGIDLKWDVSEEIDVKEYQVERSFNGISFTSVGAVPATGGSIYQFTDLSAPSSTVYYRIKNLDIDGKFKYSGVIRLAADAPNSYSNDLSLYPTPSTGDITIQHRKLVGRAKMLITSLDGKVVKLIYPTPGSSHTPANISDLAPGIYLLKLDDGSGYGKAVKLIKN